MALLLCFLVSADLPGSLDLDPGLRWYTLETEHFSIHFSSRGRPDSAARAFADRTGATAEQVRADFAARGDLLPGSRTNIIVADFFDYANGWASPLPENTILVIPTQPRADRTNYDDWLRTLLTHEYAHILQMDMVRGIPSALRQVFGRIVLVNALLPVWLLEGYAVLAETELTPFGRARGPEYDMMLRAAANSGALLSIDRCATYELEQHPGGTAPYLYGGAFCRHLAQEHGPQVWHDYSWHHAGGLPLLDDYHSGRVFGMPFAQLWHNWQEGLRIHAETTRARLGSTTPLQHLTDEGFACGAPLWSRTGAELYYVSRTGREYPAIKAADIATKKTRTLRKARVSGNLSLSPDGRWLAYSELVSDNHRDCSDIFALDLYQGQVRRLTRNLRARDPEFSPDSSSLLFVATRLGSDELMTLDLRTGAVTSLTEAGDPVSYHQPRYSPDGRYIAVGANHLGGHADIELIDTETGWTVPVTEDRANDLHPCWSRIGKYLFFVSDRTGIFNLYAYSLATGRLHTCSNTEYGLFEPAVAPDNRSLAVTSHSSQGDNISLLPLDVRTWHRPALFQDTLPDSRPEPRPSPSTLYHYNPLPSVLPRFWLPLVQHDSLWTLGAFTFGWDVLQFHRYALAAGHRLGQTPFLLLDYAYSRLWPRVRTRADIGLDVRKAVLGLEFPFRTNRRSTWLGFDLEAKHDSVMAAGSGISLVTSNAFRYRFCVAPNQGAVTGFWSGLESKALLGLRDRVRVSAWHTGYFGNPPQNWSFSFRLATGTAFGDTSVASAWHIEPGPDRLAVRGYRTAQEPGRNIVTAGTEFRIPAWVERGPGLAPVFLSNFNLALFVDWGMTWNQTLPQTSDWQHSRAGVGAEVRADLVLAYLLPLDFAVGWAYGLGPDQSDTQLYLRLESPYLSDLLARERPEGTDLPKPGR